MVLGLPRFLFRAKTFWVKTLLSSIFHSNTFHWKLPENQNLSCNIGMVPMQKELIHPLFSHFVPLFYQNNKSALDGSQHGRDVFTYSGRIHLDTSRRAAMVCSGTCFCSMIQGSSLFIIIIQPSKKASPLFQLLSLVVQSVADWNKAKGLVVLIQ